MKVTRNKGTFTVAGKKYNLAKAIELHNAIQAAIDDYLESELFVLKKNKRS